MPPDPGWSSLEIAKLVVAALTPLAVAVFGLVVDRRLRRVEAIQWANQTVVTRRAEIFTVVGPKLNQLLCFATFVGRWKEIMPQEAVTLKRDLDEIMFANRVLFSNELFTAYEQFMAAMFAMYASTDTDALIRVPVATTLGDRRNLPWWSTDPAAMAARFSTADPTTPAQVQHAYEVLGQRWRADLYVTDIRNPLLVVPAPDSTITRRSGEES
jgi:hypothetical protein